MTSTTTHLGGNASNVNIYKIGFGLMGMTWTPNPLPDEQAFEAFKTAIDQTPPNVKLFINSGEFYGNEPNKEANLHLIARFFEKYPELADRTFLSVKGGVKPGVGPDSSLENLRASVDNINKALNGKKRLDLFETARIDPKVAIEEAMRNLKILVEEGKFDHVGLSECKAETVERAHKVYPVAAVEIEVSLWSYEEETKRVIEATRKLGIPVIAYSPLGRGFLTGTKKLSDLHENDMKRRFSRFQEDVIDHNLSIIDSITPIADRKHITPAQLSLAWVSSLGPHVVPLPGSGKPSRVIQNLGAGKIELTEEEKNEIGKILGGYEVKGGRYMDGKVFPEFLWG